jgi:quercetin dioxygenase-like cupin family protein
LHLLHGEMNVQVNGEKFTLSKGDVLAFPGDVQHSYENPLKIKSVALSVVAIAPVNSFH